MNRTDIELWSGHHSRVLGPNIREELGYEVLKKETKKINQESKCRQHMGNYVERGHCEVYHKLELICIVVEPFTQIIENYLMPEEVTDGAEI